MASDAGVRAFRFRIGDITCAIVSDGTFAYAEPGHLLFANAPQAARDSVLGANGIDADARHEYVSPYSALLIDTGQRHILVDTGAGNLAATTGQLRDHLRAEDVDLAGIDMVVLTHAHADHIGGNLDAEGRPAFPSARWVLWRDEWQFWTRAPNLSSLPVPEPIKDLLIDSARRNLLPLERQIQLIDQDTELTPGVQAVAAAGHTPGHLVVAVASEGQRLLWSGDTFLHPVHISHPEWYAAVDLRPEQAIATRRQLLAWVADEGMLLHAAHFPWPGLGRVRRADAGFRWEPIGPAQPGSQAP
jgi:glyoxylase-like metal-dependent hydrolase (beta-lactamase superfamily II)